MSAHNRQWTDEHIAAGYADQDWGSPPTKKAKVIGDWEGINGRICVRHLDAGPTGVPELELEWDNGKVVTVLNEEVATQYLLIDGAVRLLK